MPHPHHLSIVIPPPFHVTHTLIPSRKFKLKSVDNDSGSQDLIPTFRDFVTNEKQRLTQKRQAIVRSEMDKRMSELVKFSQSFKVHWWTTLRFHKFLCSHFPHSSTSPSQKTLSPSLLKTKISSAKSVKSPPKMPPRLQLAPLAGRARHRW